MPVFFPNFNKPEPSPPSSSSSTPKPSKPHHENFISNLQNHCSSFFQNLSNSFPKPNLPNFNPIQHFQNPFQTPKPQQPLWARISTTTTTQKDNPTHCFDLAMSTESIEERLAGVPVYALSNSAEEFVLISGVSSGKSLGLFCFKKEDAESLLEQMKSMNPDMRKGSKVVPVALNKVIQLKLEGVAFRFIPDSSQIKNALKEKQKVGLPNEDFYGVPVFQSQSLILRNENKRYRPVFFRKEDLEKSLTKASRQQNQLNPLLRQGTIQVGILEDIIRGMQEGSTSKWDDIVFIPPGFDISTDLPEREKLTANG